MCKVFGRGSTENQVLLQQRELLRKYFTGNLILLKDLCTRDCVLQHYHDLSFIKSFQVILRYCDTMRKVTTFLLESEQLAGRD